jgi:hypothetical protein
MQKGNDETIKSELPGNEVIRELPLYTNLLRATIIILLVIFILGSITCLTLFILNAFGITNLSDTALCALAGATIAEVAGLLGLLFKKVV